MFRLKDQCEFAITVNGVDMQVGADLLQDVSIVENSTNSVPSLSVTFCDNKKRFSSFGIFADGSAIQVTVGDGKSGSSTRTYQFAQWSMKDACTNSAGNVVTLNGVANVVGYLTQLQTKNIKGNSSDAIRQAASAGGVGNVEADSTSDQMNWLPDGRTICQWCKKVAAHGWLGGSSAPFLVMTSDASGNWLLRYKNILAPLAPSGKLVSMGLAQPGDIVIWDYRINTESMYYNSLINYGYKVYQPKLTGKTDSFGSMDISSMVSSLGINSSMTGLVSQFFHHPDRGNTHPHYAEAEHHNVKAQALFSTDVHVLLDQITQYKIMDDVSITLALSDGTVDSAFSGAYRVSAITRHISKGHYREKLIVSSPGQNASAASIAGGD